VKSRRREEEEKTTAGAEVYKNSGTRAGTADKVEEIGKAAGTRQEQKIGRRRRRSRRRRSY
jgi:hypothetical protein